MPALPLPASHASLVPPHRLPPPRTRARARARPRRKLRHAGSCCCCSCACVLRLPRTTGPHPGSGRPSLSGPVFASTRPPATTTSTVGKQQEEHDDRTPRACERVWRLRAGAHSFKATRSHFVIRPRTEGRAALRSGSGWALYKEGRLLVAGPPRRPLPLHQWRTKAHNHDDFVVAEEEMRRRGMLA